VPKGVLIVMTEPLEGKEEEFNDWYDNVHIPEFLKTPGFAAAQRFIAVPWMRGELPDRPYMTLYEFDTDVEEVKEANRQARSGRSAESPPVIDTSASIVYAFEAIRERVEAPPG
jgi:hypothetical protein